MKGDLHPAAVRLSAALPCRTHERPVPANQKVQSANNTRAVRINGTVYESLTEAARQRGTHRDAIRKMIHAGAAAYLDGKRKSGRGPRIITYLGKRYEGIADAMAQLKIGKDTLYKLLDSGEARRE